MTKDPRAIPTVSVVVPCRNEVARIAALLDALAAQTYLPSEVVIVDDGSTDGTRGAVERWRASHPTLSIVIAEEGGRGAGAAMNTGIRGAFGDVIVRLDGHCRPQPNYIAASLETLAQPRAGVVGGVWTIEPGAPTVTAAGIAAVLSHPLGSGGAEYRHLSSEKDLRPRTVDTVPFGTFTRATWASIGGFDETLLRNQDYDFNYRVRRSGLDIVLNPTISSAYKARATMGALARQYYAYGFWKVRMLRKFPESIRLRQLLPLAVVPVLAVSAAAVLFFGSAAAAMLILGYVAADIAGGLQAALRRGRLASVPAAIAALFVLQLSWGAGAWASLAGGRR